MAETNIRPALPAQELAGPLIEAHHDHLKTARILWLFTSATRKKQDRVRLASAARLSVLQRFLASGMESMTSYDFIIIIGERQWGGLSQAQRIALVDHELCHCRRSEKVNRRGVVHRAWFIAGHDLEEFADVVRRHGLWKTDVKKFAQVIPQQLPLDEDPDASAPPRRARRTTTVEPDGIVASSEREDPPAAASEVSETPTATSGVGSETSEAPSPDAPAANGVEHAPGWQEQTGIGTNELAQHRRRRAARSTSESVPTT